MFNNFSYNNYSYNNAKYIIEAAEKGVELLSKNIDYSTLNIWRKYILSIINLVSKNTNKDIISIYMQFNLSIMMFSPYEQVKRTVEFLINIAKVV